MFQKATPCASGDSSLNGDEVEDDAPGADPAALVLGAIERRCDQDRRGGRGLPQLVDQRAKGALVLVRIEPRHIALVGTKLEDDERRVPQRELVLPVGAVLSLPVRGHRGVRAQRVVDDAGPLALERHTEEAHGATAQSAHREPGLAVVRSHGVDARHLRAPPRREALGRRAVHRQLHVTPARLLQIVEVIARHLATEVAPRGRAERGHAAAEAAERHAAQAIHPVGRRRPCETARRPLVVRAVQDVVVEVPLPGIRDEDEPVPRVPEPRLQSAAHRARDVVARDRRVAVVQNARDRAGFPAVGPGEAGDERVERVAGRVLDGHVAQGAAHPVVDRRQRLVRLAWQGVVDRRGVLRGRERLLSRRGRRRLGRLGAHPRLVEGGRRVPGPGDHPKRGQLWGRVGDRERRDHHEERARCLPEERVLTQSHIDPRGG